MDLLKIGILFLLLNLFVIMDLIKFASFILVYKEVAVHFLIIIIRYSLYLAKGSPSVPTQTAILFHVFEDGGLKKYENHEDSHYCGESYCMA